MKRYRHIDDKITDTPRTRVIQCCIKFRAQWGTSPFQKLWLAALYRTMDDLLKPVDHIDHMQAVQWLRSDLDELQLCNIEPEWVRDVLIKAGLLADFQRRGPSDIKRVLSCPSSVEVS